MRSDKKKSNLKNALRKYFRGEESAAGEHAFQVWFGSFDDSKGASDTLPEAQSAKRMNKAFRAIEIEIEQTEKTGTPLMYSNHKARNKKLLPVRLAALFIVGILISLGAFYVSESGSTRQSLVNIVEKQNPAGQITAFHLPDGTAVWLNADSYLQFPEVFNEVNREIYLNGEAYFEVAHNPDKPFIVRTNSLTTRALGTSFNIKAYREDAMEEVTLVTGKAEVSDSDNNEHQILNPDQKIRYEPEGGLQEPASAVASLVKAWTQRELVFVRENFETIAKTFERWYDVEFLFEDEELKKEVFVYHFKNLSLRNSMTVLNELADFDYEITDNTVIVRKPESR